MQYTCMFDKFVLSVTEVLANCEEKYLGVTFKFKLKSIISEHYNLPGSLYLCYHDTYREEYLVALRAPSNSTNHPKILLDALNIFQKEGCNEKK